jgi:hypothetical protein
MELIRIFYLLTGSGLGEQRGMGEASGDDEFRPFVRRLPEWQFWCVLISLPNLPALKLTFVLG